MEEPGLGPQGRELGTPWGFGSVSLWPSALSSVKWAQESLLWRSTSPPTATSLVPTPPPAAHWSCPSSSPQTPGLQSDSQGPWATFTPPGGKGPQWSRHFWSLGSACLLPLCPAAHRPRLPSKALLGPSCLCVTTGQQSSATQRLLGKHPSEALAQRAGLIPALRPRQRGGRGFVGGACSFALIGRFCTTL